MKMIACQSCGEQVSNLATKCPHCGELLTGVAGSKYDTGAPKKSGAGGSLLWIVLILAAIGGGVWYFVYH